MEDMYIVNIAEAEDDDFSEFLPNEDKITTKRIIQSAVKSFGEFLKSGKTEIKDIDDLNKVDSSVLSSVLGKFYVGARKEDGNLYAKKSLKTLKFGLQKHFMKTRSEDIIKDSAFKDSNIIFQAVLTSIPDDASQAHMTVPIIPADIDKLYGSGLFDKNTPQGLQSRVFFEFVYYFGKAERNFLRTLQKRHFEINFDDLGNKYVKLTRQNNVDGKILVSDAMIIGINGDDLCPLASFEKYLNCLDPTCEDFWQRPKGPRDFFKTYGQDIWYDKNPLGKNSLSGMMSSFSKKAGLSQSYANKCIRATCIDNLKRSGISYQDVIAYTNDRKLNCSRCLSEAKRRQIASTLHQCLKLLHTPTYCPHLPCLVQKDSQNVVEKSTSDVISTSGPPVTLPTPIMVAVSQSQGQNLTQPMPPNSSSITGQVNFSTLGNSNQVQGNSLSQPVILVGKSSSGQVLQRTVTLNNQGQSETQKVLNIRPQRQFQNGPYKVSSIGTTSISSGQTLQPVQNIRPNSGTGTQPSLSSSSSSSGQILQVLNIRPQSQGQVRLQPRSSVNTTSHVSSSSTSSLNHSHQTLGQGVTMRTPLQILNSQSQFLQQIQNKQPRILPKKPKSQFQQKMEQIQEIHRQRPTKLKQQHEINQLQKLQQNLDVEVKPIILGATTPTLINILPVNAQFMGQSTQNTDQTSNFATTVQPLSSSFGQQTGVPVTQVDGQQQTSLPVMQVDGQQQTGVTVMQVDGQQQTSLPVMQVDGQQQTGVTVMQVDGQQQTSLPVMQVDGQQQTGVTVMQVDGQQQTSAPVMQVDGQQTSASAAQIDTDTQFLSPQNYIQALQTNGFMAPQMFAVQVPGTADNLSPQVLFQPAQNGIQPFLFQNNAVQDPVTGSTVTATNPVFLQIIPQVPETNIINTDNINASEPPLLSGEDNSEQIIGIKSESEICSEQSKLHTGQGPQLYTQQPEPQLCTGQTGPQICTSQTQLSTTKAAVSQLYTGPQLHTRQPDSPIDSGQLPQKRKIDTKYSGAIPVKKRHVEQSADQSDVQSDENNVVKVKTESIDDTYVNECYIDPFSKDEVCTVEGQGYHPTGSSTLNHVEDIKKEPLDEYNYKWVSGEDKTEHDLVKDTDLPDDQTSDDRLVRGEGNDENLLYSSDNTSENYQSGDDDDYIVDDDCVDSDDSDDDAYSDIEIHTTTSIRREIAKSNEVFTCGVCDDRFSSSEEVVKHCMTHTLDKKHRCQLCNCEFLHIKELENHPCTARTTPTYKCSICNVRLHSLQSLLDHKQTHTLATNASTQSSRNSQSS